MSTKEYRKTKDLKLWEQNPRSIRKEDFERLKKQIQELGQYKPLIITKDGEVIGGNMRLRAYRELGIEDVWVSVVDPKDDMEKLKYALSDNDRAGYYDDDLLANLSSAFPDFEWSDYAVDLTPPETLDKVLFKEEVQEDEVPEVSDKEPISKLGEVYQLGRHKLMCGDSTKIEDVEKLMNGQKADITFHSPPYNVGHNLGYGNDSKYENYKDNNPEYLSLLTSTTNNALNVSEYVFVNLQFLANNKIQIIDYLFEMKEMFCDIAFWKKLQVAPEMAKNVMNTQVECIFIFNKTNQSRAINTGNFHGNVSNFVETKSASGENENADKHNATFPVSFVSHFISHFTKDNGIVLDLFGGSGSTLIACEQLNRTCYMMEIDPVYVDVIRKRYAKFVGKENEWEKVSPKVQ